MKILIIALSGAGDVLMSTSLIRELRLSYPKAEIDCLVMQGAITKEILQNNLDIDKVIYFNFMKEGYIKSLIYCSKIRKKKYDLSITVYPQARYPYSLISFLIGAKRRIGFNYETQKIKFNKLFFTDTVEEAFSSHVITNNSKILNALHLKPKMRSHKITLNLKEENYKFANSFFKENKIRKAAVIHAGSGKTKNFMLKRWPEDRFAELCKELSKRGYKIILVGGEDDNKIKNIIIKDSGLMENKEIFNLNTNILNVAAIIKKSSRVISNDTIMGHIAAAVGTKVICLFGPTSWENTAPFTKNRIIICKRPSNVKSYKHGDWGITEEQARFMNNITVEEVLSKIK